VPFCFWVGYQASQGRLTWLVNEHMTKIVSSLSRTGSLLGARAAEKWDTRVYH
jgi:hypothetical protein